jgi:hypothetical protein
MKTPVVWVTAALTAAIVLAASFVIATGTRGENYAPMSSPAKAGDPVSQRSGDENEKPRRTGSPGQAGR